MKVLMGKWMAFSSLSMSGRNIHCCTAISARIDGVKTVGGYALIDEVIGGSARVLKEYSEAWRAEHDLEKIHGRSLQVGLDAALPEFDLDDANLYQAEGFGAF